MKKILHSRVMGFSLIEALIAALIVAVAMLGLAKLQYVTLSNSADSRMKTHALNLAQDKIEQLRSYANQNTYTGYSGSDFNTAAGANSTFTRTWTITACANSVNCKQANVAVTWADPKGATQTVQLTSYIAQTDPVKSGVILLAGTSTSSTSSSTSSTSSSTGSSSTSSTGSSSTGSSTSSTSTSSGGGTGSCSCLYKNNGQGASLNSTGSSDSCCSDSFCNSNIPTGQSNNSNFTVVCPLSCTWTGGTVASSSSVTAYLAETVPYGGTCASVSQSRLCTNGTLSGSYNYTSCTVQAGATCTVNGSTITSGESVTAYQSAAPAGACVSESRLCTNGSVSGSYANSSCTAGCTVGSTSVASGGSITAYTSATPTGACVSQSETCTNGMLSGTLAVAGYPADTCLAGCTLGSHSVASGGSITAYLAATVPYGSICASQSQPRTCTAGVLSGSYSNDACTVLPAAGCTVNITGSANNKNDTIKANGNACTVAPNKNITCPTLSNVATGTIISVVSTGTVNTTKTVIVACPTTAYTVNF